MISHPPRVYVVKVLMIFRPLLLILALTLSVTTGCGAKAGSGAVDYSVSAQKNYEKGLKELDDKKDIHLNTRGGMRAAALTSCYFLQGVAFRNSMLLRSPFNATLP